jgi:hypothetical protein
MHISPYYKGSVRGDLTYCIILMCTIKSDSFPLVDVPLQLTQFTTLYLSLSHYSVFVASLRNEIFLSLCTLCPLYHYVLYALFCILCTDIVRLLLYFTLLFAVFFNFCISQCSLWSYFFLFACPQIK